MKVGGQGKQEGRKGGSKEKVILAGLIGKFQEAEEKRVKGARVEAGKFVR